MSVDRLSASGWLRRLAIHIGSPAVIGAIVAFFASHALEAWRDERTSNSSFLASQKMADDARIDEIRKLVSPPAETCKDVLAQTASFEDASASLRTDYGKVQLIPFAQRLKDKKQLCAVYETLEKMPKATSVEIAHRIAFVQQAQDQFASAFGVEQLARKLSTLRDARAAAIDAEAQDEIRRKNEAIAKQAVDDAARLQAVRAAAEAGQAADRARREGERYDRILQGNINISR